MKKIFLICSILSIALITNSQTLVDTIYFSKDYIKVSKQEAAIISIQNQKDSFLTVTEYHNTMKIKALKTYRIRNMGKKNEYRMNYGPFEDYHDNGILQAKGTLVENKLNGLLVSYYNSGKLLREDTYENGNLIQGKCIDKEGIEIPYFPYRVEPEYPNGPQEMFKFLAQNIRYPTVARENGIEGIVYVGFVVDTDGSIVDVKVKRGVSQEMNEEGVRVVKAMPKWQAGKVDNELVRVAYTLPIKFKFEGGNGLFNWKKKKK